MKLAFALSVAMFSFVVQKNLIGQNKVVAPNVLYYDMKTPSNPHGYEIVAPNALYYDMRTPQKV